MKKINQKKLLFIFIIILPILDISSFLFRNYFKTTLSISTFLRPLIPLLLLIKIFLENKLKLKIFFLGCIYGIYAIAHLYIFSKLNYGISYGNWIHEFQYLVNYSFAILNLFLFIFVFYKDVNYKKISKMVLIANGIYLISIYASIFTKTSSTTYIEGQGFKGWFESGNSISAILILNLFFIFTLFQKNENKYIKIISGIETIFSGIFLTLFLGTRTGVLGLILVIGLFSFSKLFKLIIIKITENRFNLLDRIIVFVIIPIVIIFVGFFSLKSISNLARRKYLENMNTTIMDSSTGNASHVTGDILNLKEQIENGSIDEKYASLAIQKSILDLYNTANTLKLDLTNRRAQQLIYNFCLVKNQSNILYLLLGNGFLNNYGELILEMEIPAFLFNFGIVGLTLYFMPFLLLFIYYTYIAIKNLRKIDSEFIFLFSGILLSFILSFLVGQLYFNSSAMIIIICMNVVLFNKCNELNNEDKYDKIMKKEYKELITKNI